MSIWNYATGTLIRTFEITDVPVRCIKWIARKNWFVAGESAVPSPLLALVWPPAPSPSPIASSGERAKPPRLARSTPVDFAWACWWITRSSETNADLTLHAPSRPFPHRFG